MSGWDYFISAYRDNYFNFEGRARRSEYWYFVLFKLISFIVFLLIISIFESWTLALVIFGLGFLASIIPWLALNIRRLHDIGYSGSMFLVCLLPFLGGIWLFGLYCTDSEPGTNKYGPNPKEDNDNVDEDELINTIGN